MKYRRLGMWGVKVSEVGFGSWLTMNKGGDELAAVLHRTAYENGINFFDTANVYGRGETEVLVGRALRPFIRDTYVLATKVFWPWQREWPFPGANDRGLSRKHIFEQCHASLKRLGVEYIDLYQCHRADSETPIIETCRAMNDLINQGKVLYWGVSEWNADQIAEAATTCEEHGWHRPVSNQPLYNMLERHWERNVFPMCRELGMGIVNFSPLAEGLLTGKYNNGIPEGSRASDEAAGQFIKPRMTDHNMEVIRKLARLADGLNIPLSNLALAWCLSRPEISSTIIGATKPQQIIENAKASEIHLDEDVLDRINAILGG
ncbi:MAG TPA: aldo/keto reductase family protein [Phycisphaerales bacterium]|nr:aldo/keto reductase family protein [Phycisphaerales bacterium]